MSDFKRKLGCKLLPTHWQIASKIKKSKNRVSWLFQAEL